MPALSPRMPVITEDVGQSRSQVRSSIAKGYMNNILRLNAQKETTGIRFVEPAPFMVMQLTMTNCNNSSIATHRAA